MSGDPMHGTPDLALAVDVVHLYGNNDGRLWFAGVRLDESNNHLVVFRVPGGDFDAIVTDIVPTGVQVDFVDAPHTRAELLEARERVFDLTDKIAVVDIRVPNDGTTISVDVSGSADDAELLLRREVPGLVSVRVTPAS
jgi:hypothetical protein